jgi:crossover junction endodeoxyribonuclease RuvC
MADTEVIVLGIDPGTAVTGYGVVARRGDGAVSLRECGVIRTESGAPLPERLRDIYEGVVEIMERHAPAAVAVEGVFFGKNARTAVVLGHARGAILLAAAMRDVEVAEYPPAEIKSAVVGVGRATKEQVALMVKQHLKLRDVPRPSDASDGVAVALCHCYRGFGQTPAVSPMRFSLELLRQGNPRP